MIRNRVAINIRISWLYIEGGKYYPPLPVIGIILINIY